MKVDFKKSMDGYSARRNEFRVVDLPPTKYLMVDGRGDPNTAQQYADALTSLYPVAYAMKFASRRDRGRDYVVPPLEATWWAEDLTAFTDRRDKSQWNWTVMVMVPDWIDRSEFDAAVTTVTAKRRPARIDDVRLETLHEGRCVQTLHIGAYDDEGPVLAAMHRRFIPESGLAMTGRHHEIYLSDPRRAPAAKLRTILRQPVLTVTGEN